MKMIERELRIKLAHRNRPGEKSKARAPAFRRAVFYARVDFLKQARHAQHHRWANLAHVLAYLIHTFGVVNAHAVMYVHIHARALEDGREREHGGNKVRSAERERIRAVNHVRDYVRVRELTA